MITIRRTELDNLQAQVNRLVSIQVRKYTTAGSRAAGAAPGSAT